MKPNFPYFVVTNAAAQHFVWNGVTERYYGYGDLNHRADYNQEDWQILVLWLNERAAGYQSLPIQK